MAYDKAVDSAALDAGLTAIANAIREKSGSSGALAFPDAMAAAIAAIEAGGGGIETGTFCPTEFKYLRSNPINVVHTLNAVPKYIFVCRDDELELTDTRTKNEIYCILASPEKVFAAYNSDTTNYSRCNTICNSANWTSSPTEFGAPRISIGSVTDNSFVIGSTILQVGFDAAINYRWVVVA